MAIALEGKAGELTFTVQVTRAETGLVEEVEMTGYITEGQLELLQQTTEEN